MKSFLFSIFFLFFIFNVNGQVGIGTTSPDASSVLDVTSANSGLLIPRIDLTSSTDNVTIASPATSLLIYNTGLGGFSPAGYYYWNGTSWITLAGSGGSDWTLTGNSGTTAGTNFIGTADAVDLRIKTGGSDRLNISNTNGQLQSYTTTGSAAAPSYSFSGTQTSTGMFNPTTDNLGFSTAGTEKVRIEDDGDVGIGAIPPNASAKLEIKATDRGLLIPNVVLSATNVAAPIVAPATSLLVYNTATAGVSPNNVVPGFYYWDGVWVPLSTGLSSNDWNILGNTNIVDGTNFIGTGASTNVDVAFRRNNAAAGKIGATSTSFGVGALTAGAATTSTAFGTNALAATTGGGNVAVGNGALTANITGTNNTAVGTSALAANTASGNTAVGISALAANTNATNNTAVGNFALGANTTGTDNTALGINALRNNTGVGATNTAVGSNALFTNTTAAGNTAVGFSALRLNAATTGNTAVGYQALRYHIAANNTAVGYNALSGAAAGMNASAANNTAVGYAALTANLVGASNTAIGTSALTLNTASGNTAVGSSALAANTSATGNTAIGSSALAANTAASNTAVGFSALTANSTGTRNTALGTNALAANNTPSDNTAVGYNALTANTVSVGTGVKNTAVGSLALAGVNGGESNTAVGYNALSGAIATARYNTAVGSNALSGVASASAQYNVAIGYNALPSAGTITNNVAVGVNALQGTNNNATRNTAIGDTAGSNITSGSYNIAIGYNAQVPDGTLQNQVRIGDTNIGYAGIQVSWTVTSDRRWKDNIKNCGLGLDFLKTLRPVSYIRNNDAKGKTEYGFIAQELEKAFIDAEDSNNGVISKDDKGMLGVRYNDFIAITVKAVQEQQAEIEALKKANVELMKTNEAILKRLEALEKK